MVILSTSFGHNDDLFQDTELKKIFTELICDAGVQNPLYKSRVFAISEDPSRILNGMLLTLMSAQTLSV